MWHLIGALFKTAVVLIVVALALFLSAYSGHIITFVLVLMTIGVLAFIVFRKPNKDYKWD